jgi:hypothetical protein
MEGNLIANSIHICGDWACRLLVPLHTCGKIASPLLLDPH